MVSRFELGRHGPPVLDAALVAKQTQTCKGLDVLIDRLSTPGLTRIFHFLQVFFCEFLAEVHSSFNDCKRNASGLHRGYRILLTGSCLGVHEQGPQTRRPTSSKELPNRSRPPESWYRNTVVIFTPSTAITTKLRDVWSWTKELSKNT